MHSTYREQIEQPKDRIIVALDNMTWSQAEDTMREVGPNVGMGKLNSLAQKLGWEHAVRTVSRLGAMTMADTKFHDIPETVRLQVKEVVECGASLVTVHASGGQAMLEAAVTGREQARDALVERNQTAEIFRDHLGGILGITVLTSLDTDDCVSIYGDTPSKKVLDFAHIAQAAGADGIVCSAQELRLIRSRGAFDGLLTVVPGITPEWTKKAGDQKRIATPGSAINDGADFIVVGRAITRPPEGMSRAEAAARIAEEIAM